MLHTSKNLWHNYNKGSTCYFFRVHSILIISENPTTWKLSCYWQILHHGVSLNEQFTVGFVVCHYTHPDHVARLSQGENLGMRLPCSRVCLTMFGWNPICLMHISLLKGNSLLWMQTQLTMQLPAQLLSSTCTLIECPLYVEVCQPHMDDLIAGMLVFLFHKIVWLAFFTSKQLGRTLKTWSNCAQQLECVLPCILKIYQRSSLNILYRDISLSPAASH